MGKALRRGVGKGGGRGGANVGNWESGIVNRNLPAGCRFLIPYSRLPFWRTLGLLLGVTEHAAAQDSASRYDRGRFTIVAYKTDELLAKSLLASAVARDTFPGLVRPAQRVVIAIAPDGTRLPPRHQEHWTGEWQDEAGNLATYLMASLDGTVRA